MNEVVVCCDAGVMRRVSELMNEELRSHEVVHNWVKSEVKLGAMKSGVTWHRLPN